MIPSPILRTLFLSTLSLRRATLVNVHNSPNSQISIHALLAESDECRSMSADGFARISIHALLAESDFIFSSPVSISKKFLSTLSLRRATLDDDLLTAIATLFLSTLSLRRATAPLDVKQQRPADFYPRSPCGERPVFCRFAGAIIGVFLSTLSLRRATVGQKRLRQKLAISIHALLAESDIHHRTRR